MEVMFCFLWVWFSNSNSDFCDQMLLQPESLRSYWWLVEKRLGNWEECHSILLRSACRKVKCRSAIPFPRVQLMLGKIPCHILFGSVSWFFFFDFFPLKFYIFAPLSNYSAGITLSSRTFFSVSWTGTIMLNSRKRWWLYQVFLVQFVP